MAALALDVARDLVMYLKRPGGQSQFSVSLAAQATQHGGVQAAQQWVLAHLDQPMPLALLAGKAAMSERNFRRVFQQETGCTPAPLSKMQGWSAPSSCWKTWAACR